MTKVTSMIEPSSSSMPGTDPCQELAESMKLRLELKGFALNQLSDAVFLRDVGTLYFTYVNLAACKGLGYSEEELLRMSPADIDPDWTDESIRDVREKLKAGLQVSQERRHRRKDGSLFPVDVSFNYLEYEEKTYFLAVARDATQRKHNERELGMLHAAVERLSDATYVIDEQARFRYVNKAASRAVGYSPKELLTMTILDIDPDITQEGLKDIMQKTVWSGDRPHLIETHHRRRDGTTFPVSVTSTSFEYDDEMLNISMARDLGASKEAERERARNIHFLEVLDRVNQVIQSIQDVDQLEGAILDIVLDALQCDRAYILTRADAETKTFSITSVRSRPEYPPPYKVGAKLELGQEAATFVSRKFQDDGEVIKIDASGLAMLDGAAQRYGFRSLMSVQMNPKGADLMYLGVLQISHERHWLPEEDRLLKEIGRRLADGIAALLAIRERLVYLRYLETMDQVSRAIRDAETVEQMEHDVLDIAMRTLECDRTYMLDFDHETGKWIFCAITYRPKYPPPTPVGGELEIDPVIASRLRGLYEDVEVAVFGTNEEPVPESLAKRYGYKSNLSVKFTPKGSHYMYLGVLQIESNRVWRPDEVHLMAEIARRLAVGISAMRSYRQLQVQERQYRTLGENMPDLIMRFDRKCRGIYSNRSMLAAMAAAGLAPELQGKAPTERMQSESSHQLEAWIRSTIDSGTPCGGEMPVEFEGGHQRIFEVRVVPDRSGQGEIIGALAIARDVTERIASAEKIRNLNDDLSSILMAVPDLLFEVDAEGTYLQVWTHRPELLADTKENLLGKRISEVLSPEAARVSMEALREAAISGSSYGKVLRLDLPDGMHWFELSVARKGGGDEANPHFIRVSRDITERMNAEINLKESRAQLRAMARRSEVAREDERRRIARELHDELGQQLSALRFEISILDYQFGAKYPDLTASIAELLALVEKTIQTTRNVSVSLRPAALDMGIIPALELLVSEYSRHLNVVMHQDIRQADFRLPDDVAITVFRIVQESLTNVVRYAKASKVTVELKVTERAVTVTVLDDGIGFDPRSVRKKSFGLLGIRERCLAVGGKATITSAPGKGTEISVRIPIKQGEK